MNCPICNGENVIPILYGNLDNRAYDLADQELVRLGGCITPDNNPLWFCTECYRELPGRSGIQEHEALVDVLFRAYSKPSEMGKTTTRAKSAIRFLARCFRDGATQVKLTLSDHRPKTLLTTANGDVEIAGPPIHIYESVLGYLAQASLDSEWLALRSISITPGESATSVLIHSLPADTSEAGAKVLHLTL